MMFRAPIAIAVVCLMLQTNDPPGVKVPQDPADPGYLNLHKRHPDALDGPVEFNAGFGTEVALRRLDQMQGFLKSFARLTDRVRGTVPAAELSAIANTGRDIQTIGFHNIPQIVEGTLLRQDYRLRQVEYELAQLKHARGEIAPAELDRARQAYADATKLLQKFWDTKLPVD